MISSCFLCGQLRFGSVFSLAPLCCSFPLSSPGSCVACPQLTMEMQCFLSRSLQPLSPCWFPSRSINSHVTERRTLEETEPSGRLINRKLDFPIEGLQPQQTVRCCHGVLTSDSRTESQCRSLLLDCDHDVNLVNIEESNNGFVLFKFGMADTREDSSMFIPSTEHERQPPVSSNRSDCVSDVVDCRAIVSRNLYDSRVLPSKNFGCFDFAKAYNDSNLIRGLTSGPMGKILDSPFECPNNGSFHKISTPDFLETNLESNEWNFPPIFTERPQPLKSPGSYSPGSEGTSIITTGGHNGFHCKSPHGVDVHFTNVSIHKGMDSAIMMVENNEPPVFCHGEIASTVKPNLSSQGAGSVKATVLNRVQRTKKKSGLGQRKSGKVVTRDICRRNSFQLYETILSYPFTNSSEAVLNFQTVPKEEFGELFNIFNQIAVGLAGSGLALVLFVASRMLSLNATLDSSKLMYLLRGIGLLWLSSALHKCGAAVRCMADVCSQARSKRKESLATFRREVQAVTFKVCAVVVLSMVRFV